jgi:hypothetical protein
MKTKSFRNYLEKRLDKKEIEEIQDEARREANILKSTQSLEMENNEEVKDDRL